MKKNIDRREFLKLAGLLSLGFSLPQFVLEPSSPAQLSDKKNILIVIFDALSAYHISFYGYPRETMPNLAKLADRAVVYHNHFAGGNYTTPGTASLLTGTLPWSHRAIVHNDTVAEEYLQKNIFHAFKHHCRMAYSHNILVNTLLKQFFGDIDHFTPRERLFLENDDLVNTLFKADEDIASVSWTRALKQKDDGYSYSLFFSRLYDAFKKGKLKEINQDFPRGLPYINTDNYFVLEDGVDFLQSQLAEAPQPFLGYYHFLPPHFPYSTRKEFYGQFTGDGYRPPLKPKHVFSRNNTPEQLLKWRTWYDEFILYADAEFARLYDYLERAELLENTWLILTSDHGELFERGIAGHLTPILHQPVIRIPLLVFEPGRESRLDVYDNTSAIDVLPTLLHLTNQELPDWLEGEVLPPYAEPAQRSDRHIFALQAKGTGKDEPITKATAMLVRGNYKLMYYFGYRELEQAGDLVELYDIGADPEELNNLHLTQKQIADELLGVVKAKLDEVNWPYR